VSVADRMADLRPLLTDLADSRHDLSVVWRSQIRDTTKGCQDDHPHPSHLPHSLTRASERPEHAARQARLRPPRLGLAFRRAETILGFRLCNMSRTDRSDPISRPWIAGARTERRLERRDKRNGTEQIKSNHSAGDERKGSFVAMHRSVDKEREGRGEKPQNPLSTLGISVIPERHFLLDTACGNRAMVRFVLAGGFTS